MRAGIEEKAKQFTIVEPEPERSIGVARSRRGHKRSKAVHNAEGLKEEELRQLRARENAHCRCYKKRHLKDLSEKDVAEIIALSKQPGWL